MQKSIKNIFLNMPKVYIAVFCMVIVICMVIVSCYIPCPPKGIYYSTLFECLHDNNRGCCIITKSLIFYIINYDEDFNSIQVLANGTIEKKDNGTYIFKCQSGKILPMTIKSYWWGLKIFVESEKENKIAFRQFGLKTPL